MRLRRAWPDPEVRRLLLQLTLMRPSEHSTLSVEDVRRDWQLAVKAFGSREPVASVSNHAMTVPGGTIRSRIYVPHDGGELLPALVWFHGGGFVFGDLYTAGSTCRALANASGAMVIAVEYKLAPEYSVHQGVDDCVQATQWVMDHADELGIDVAKIAIGGDSAGGGLAALVAQRLKGSGPGLAAQVLVYPATDLSGRSAAAAEDAPGLLDDHWVTWIREQIGRVTDLDDPALSALQATDVRGLAPAIVLTAGFDPLRDEGIAYARLLVAHGIAVRHLHFPGQIHGFLSMDRVLSAGRYGLKRLGSELALAFASGVQPDVEGDLPRRRDRDPWLWLRPEQRWHEAKVGSIVVRERAARSLRRRRSKRMVRSKNVNS